MTTVDGRVERGTRNREAIATALLSCYEDGILRPSVAEVARRAGVSVRSVHNHFDDSEALLSEVARRQWERYAHLLGPVESVPALVEHRSEFFEAVTPVRRAALLGVHASPSLARNLARLDHILREQTASLFPGVDAETLDALDALTSFDTWNRLRAAQGCSVAKARRIVTRTIAALTQGSPS